QLFGAETGCETLTERYGVDGPTVEKLRTLFGISGICNILGAIKTAKYFGLGKGDVIATIATDALDRYYSVMGDMRQRFGQLDTAAAVGRVESVFHGVRPDWLPRGAAENR